ncbi:MAG: formylglycine-generating enzyme family protein [Magnetococcales bacterium]|nr:formylglycine-generating enzyme family protein [Magnetococcales bacterium]
MNAFRRRRFSRLALLLPAWLLGGCPWPTPPLLSPDDDPPPEETLRIQATWRLGTLAPVPAAQTPTLWKDPVTGITLTRIAGGCFIMGDNQGKPHERPAHNVCLDDFWLATHETTQEQWQRIMETLPGQTVPGAGLPVENVTWNDVERFIQRLNSKGQGHFRLPTEAEWEYACRNRGQSLRYCGTNDDPTPYSWHQGSGVTLHPVGERLANGLGLHDMNGNVWEWVGDWYDENAYQNTSSNNPTGPESGTSKVFRGGGVLSGTGFLKATNRANLWPDRKNALLGFRLAGNPPVK